MIDYEKAVLHDDGTLHEFTVSISGEHYHCPNCGVNVFHKPDRENLNIYRCNGCGTTFKAL